MKRGPYGKNKQIFEKNHKEMIRLRKGGFGYGTIATQLGIPVHVVIYGTQDIPTDLGVSVTKGRHFSTEQKPFESIKHTGTIKNLLIRERGHVCECCGLNVWLGAPITIELEHVDGNGLHNNRENLKLLCPNCHSQTDTWKGKNKNFSRKKVSDQEFTEALRKSRTIRQALLTLGLTAKGANYKRAYDLGGVVGIGIHG